MIKTLYLVNTDENDNLISNSVHSSEIFSDFKSKQMKVKNISCKEVISKQWEADEGVLLVHSFDAWPARVWDKFNKSLNVPLFVIPTELTSDENLINKTFSKSSVSKIIVGSECYQKMFSKSLVTDSNKVKLIHSFSDDKLLPTNNPSQERSGIIRPPIIVVPTLLDEDKNFESVLLAISKIKIKYRNVLVMLAVKSKPSIDSGKENEIINSIYDMADSFRISNNLRMMINSSYDYKWFLKMADIIVIPQQKNNDMYNGALIDSVVSGKAVVAPDTKVAFDLCKKDAGIYLYETTTMTEDKEDEPGGPRELTNEEISDSIAENCNIIFDNATIKNIMQEQNAILGKNYLQSKISQQYINLIRRYK